MSTLKRWIGCSLSRVTVRNHLIIFCCRFWSMCVFIAGTINGTAKGYYFADERYSDRFTWFQHKIVYKSVPSPALGSLFSPSPAEWEARLRGELDDLIRIRAYNTHHKPLVLFSTAEEIPSGSTVQLLKNCDFPAPMHLQLRRYMYSFEWPVAGGWSWRAQVHSWDNEGGEDQSHFEKRRTGFTLDMVSDNILADAGWHCTNCYKKPEDLIEKLRGACQTSLLSSEC